MASEFLEILHLYSSPNTFLVKNVFVLLDLKIANFAAAPVLVQTEQETGIVFGAEHVCMYDLSIY